MKIFILLISRKRFKYQFSLNGGMELIRELKPKGIIVIPNDLRQQLQLKEYDKLSFRKEGDTLVIKKKEEDVGKFLDDFFTIARTKGKDITLEEIKKIEDESYDLP